MKQALVLSAVCALLFVAPHSKAQSCVEDAGNACLATCGVFEDPNFDLGQESSNPAYKPQIIVIPCPTSKKPNCQYVGPAIIYSDGLNCPDNIAHLRTADTFPQMKAFGHGAPVLVAGCSDGLMPLETAVRSRQSWAFNNQRRSLLNSLTPRQER